MDNVPRTAKCSQGSFMLWHLSVLHFSSWWNNIPLYWYTTCYLSIHQLMGIFFHFFTTVNNTGVPFCVQVFWIYSFLLGYIPRNGIAGSYGSLMFHLQRRFSALLHYFRFSPECIGGFNFFFFLVSISALVIIHLFDTNHLSGYEVLSHCGYDLQFLHS